MTIILSNGQILSSTLGQLSRRVRRGHDALMQTVAETRRQRLEMLIERYGKLADFNVEMGYERTESKFSRLRNASARADRPGKSHQMGDAVAREIEDKLKLPTGWMDTPPTYAELHPDDRIAHAMRVMEAMSPYQLDQAVRVLDSLAEPPPKEGTNDR